MALDWSNEEHIFKRKPNSKEINDFLSSFIKKIQSLLDIDELSYCISVSILSNSNFESTIVSILEKIKKKLQQFLSWTISRLLAISQRYLKRIYNNAMKKSLSNLHEIAKQYLSTNDFIKIVNVYVLMNVIYSNQYIQIILPNNPVSVKNEKRINNIILGKFLNYNVEILYYKPTLYWIYGDHSMGTSFIEKKTKCKSFWIKSNNDWVNYKKETTIVIDGDEDTIINMNDIITGKKLFIIDNNAIYKLISAEYIYVLTSNSPDYFGHDLKNDFIIKLEGNSICERNLEISQ